VKVVVGEILPLALVVTISPINVIPVILLLFTKRPLVNATCFLVGFIAGVAAVLGACVAIAEAVDLSTDSGHATWVTVLKLALGVYLLVAAVRKFRGRPRTGEEGAMPKWMDGIAGFSPGKSSGAGLALGAVNPKNVVVGLAAAATIASAVLSSGQQVAAIAIYVLVAVLGVAAPILATLLLGDRSHEVLDGWKAWLDQNNAAVMSVLFLIFGVVLIGQAIGATWP
jgi:threonine/homoserine/homoserine lactone efflux protein